MTLNGNRKSASMANELLQDILLHREYGGTSAIFVAPPGSGKTTALLTVAKNVCYLDSNKKKRYETVIWRGREFDYFDSIDKSGLVLHLHKSDYDNGFKVYHENGKEYDMSEVEIRLYKHIPHLNENIVKHKVNWVYPPSNYKVSTELKKILNKTGMKDADIGDEELKDNSLWWFELWYYMSKYKKMKYITFIFDEAQTIMPVASAGLHWHTTQYLFKTLFADARKRGISVYLACHGFTMIDGRIFKYQIPWKIYMKGAAIPRESDLWDNAAKLELHNAGDFFIEGPSGWGKGHFAKLNIQNLTVDFNKPKEVDTIYSELNKQVSAESAEL